MDDEIVLSYYDSLLRKSDLFLLEPGNWLNDKIIGFMFQYFQEELFKNYSSKFCFLDADLVQLVKLSNGDDVKAILSSLNLEKKEFVFIPVNNNSDIYSAGGTHWSLLIYNKSLQQYLHFDSLVGNINTNEACKVCKSFSNILTAKSKEPINVKTPAQSNGSDCGLYVVTISQLFCEANINELALDLVALTPSTVCQERVNIRDMILKKSKEN